MSETEELLRRYQHNLLYPQEALRLIDLLMAESIKAKHDELSKRVGSAKSTTPLTDAEVREEDTGLNGMVEVVSPTFAKKLELALAHVTASEAKLRDEVRRLTFQRQEMRDALSRISGLAEKTYTPTVSLVQIKTIADESIGAAGEDKT